MPEGLVIDKTNTAILIMDYQYAVSSEIPDEQRKLLLQTAADVLDEARKAGLVIIHVANIFRRGYPEVNLRNRIFREVKARGMYMEGSRDAKIHTEVSPQKDEIIITKHRASAFYGTDLEIILRSKNITQLAMMGIATEGCVLSTVRQAADMDYNVIVISDCCADPDKEIHDALVQKIFLREATVVTAQEFISAVK
jgi:nicotinamidase-related amidase